MSRERLIRVYRGCQLVAVKKADGFAGAAWSWKGSGSLARVNGSSIDDVIDKLRRALDTPENLERIRLTIVRKHQEFLSARGIDADQISVRRAGLSTQRTNRQPSCWGCKATLDSTSDFECTGCGWIICTGCGACGHGHPTFGERYLGSARAPGYADLAVHKFATRDAAEDFASREPNSRLERAAGGAGWTVTLRSEPR